MNRSSFRQAITRRTRCSRHNGVEWRLPNRRGSGRCGSRRGRQVFQVPTFVTFALPRRRCGTARCSHGRTPAPDRSSAAVAQGSRLPGTLAVREAGWEGTPSLAPANPIPTARQPAIAAPRDARIGRPYRAAGYRSWAIRSKLAAFHPGSNGAVTTTLPTPPLGDPTQATPKLAPPTMAAPTLAPPTLAANVLHFARLLRRAGLPVGPAETLAAQQRADLVDIGSTRPGAHRAAHRDGAPARAPGRVRPGLRAVLARPDRRAPGRGHGAARRRRRTRSAGTPAPGSRRVAEAMAAAARSRRTRAGGTAASGRGADRLRPANGCSRWISRR